KHSLQYFYTAVTPGNNIPEFTALGQVDGIQFEYYDSNIRKIIPETEWIQKVTDDDPNYWTSQTKISQAYQQNFKVNVATAMQRFNQTTGLHTLQMMYGCEVDDDGTVRGFKQFGYDGEDFMSLDLKTLSWVATTPQSVISKHKWDSSTGWNKNDENYLKNICPEWLQKYLTYGKHVVERKDRPEASLFQEEISSPEVVCHATGFFPKALMISWQKNGQDVLEDVQLRETLPNQDGSFQKRSILKVSAEELQKHTYTCVIEHSSLEKDLELPVSERRILRDGGLIGIIVGVIVALVVLVAVVAGIVVWKKKNSG
ncbi:major histocompatibility complex class I UDA precursor, partial [Silurus meridionalis]